MRYMLTRSQARQDWKILVEDYAKGNSPPGDATLRAVLEAAGGAPQHCSPLDALKASAAVLSELKHLPPTSTE